MRHSYTSLSLFLKCPYRYKAQYIEKRVPRQTSEAMARGTMMHEKLEADLRAKAPTPTFWVDPAVWQTFLIAGAVPEVKVDTPVLTARLDVLILSGKEAFTCDFKTGKSDGDPLQFDVYAAALHDAKGVDQLTGIFSYIDRKETSKPVVPTKQSREAVHDLVHRAETETKWFQKPGFYCTGCPLSDCRYHKPSRW